MKIVRGAYLAYVLLKVVNQEIFRLCFMMLLSMNRRAKANTCSARKYVCGVLLSLIPDGCIEPKNLYQILDFRLVGVGVSEWVKCYLVVNHATPETCASSFTIILARS